MTDETHSEEWMPIKEAPIDGSVVMGWWPSYVSDGGYMQPVKYDRVRNSWIVDWDHEEVSPEMWLPMSKPPVGARRLVW